MLKPKIMVGVMYPKTRIEVKEKKNIPLNVRSLKP
jgi:hypothetical protein